MIQCPANQAAAGPERRGEEGAPPCSSWSSSIAAGSHCAAVHVRRLVNTPPPPGGRVPARRPLVRAGQRVLPRGEENIENGKGDKM
jgi:hypothetical protein